MNLITAFFTELGQVTILMMGVVKSLGRVFRDRKLIIDQMELIGVGSLPLVLLTSVFTGAIAAWQAAYQLQGLAPLSYVGGVTSRVIMLELGPVLTGLIIAGRVGASIAAELGTMKVTEQLDALETMAISPVRYLAMPRILAMTVMMPVLVMFANIIAMLGALVVSSLFLGISDYVFIDSVKKTFQVQDVTGGLIKAVVFGAITSILGCHIGFQADDGAEGVGLATIKSFVVSSAMILVMDYVMWVLLF
jgi:phospholipid/cholesterol/gamma-HCH transport system permease protein